MESALNDLYQYNFEMNERFIKVFENTDSNLLSEKAGLLMSHILNAHSIWLARLQEPLVSVVGVWEVHPTESLSTINALNYELTHPFLTGTEKDLNTLINYTNTKGQSYTNSVRDILLHIVNHSTYHRAQIATEFKNMGLEVPNSDYIFYARALKL